MSDDIDDPNLKAEIAADNEKAKLEATMLNNVGVGLILTGVVAPFIAWLYNLSSMPDVSPVTLILGAIAWGGCAVILNRIGQRNLDDIR